MNIDELSKLAFAEITKELDSQNSNREISNNIEVNKEEIEQVNTENIYENIDKKVVDDISEFERMYLKRIRERIIVLFETLNAKQNENDLEKRLDITISFIEFLLANIEERLKD